MGHTKPDDILLAGCLAGISGLCIWLLIGLTEDLVKWLRRPRKRAHRFKVIAMPPDIRYHNGCREACDTFSGPCVCGAWHHRDDWDQEIIDQVDAYYVRH